MNSFSTEKFCMNPLKTRVSDSIHHHLNAICIFELDTGTFSNILSPTCTFDNM